MIEIRARAPAYICHGTTRLAILQNGLLLSDLEHGFWIFALATQHKSRNEAVEHVLKLASVVRAIHDREARVVFKLGLCAELAAEILGRVYFVLYDTSP